MSQPGKGRPVDELDDTCKKFKDCLRCAKDQFGDSCIGEFVRYKYGEVGRHKICKDSAGTCERAVCECDLQFAKKHLEASVSWNKEKHVFLTTTGWDAEKDCVRPGGHGNNKCCGKPTGASKIYNPENSCCVDGEVGPCFSG